jgi:hypothetical protein
VDEWLIFLCAFITLTAVAIACSIIAVRRDGRGMADLIGQLIVWLSVAALLPLTGYAGAVMIHPQHKLHDLLAEQSRTQSETYDTKDVSAREKSRDKAEALRKQIESEQHATYQTMFWVGFPIGYAALVAGFFLRTVSVGSGLAFGGLCTLSQGCYSYWNDMGDTLRFVSLLLVLVSVVAIGLIKFGRSPGRG